MCTSAMGTSGLIPVGIWDFEFELIGASTVTGEPQRGVEITAERVAIVTDMAVEADHIDEAKVEEARQRAAARLQDKLSDEEVATINASMARSLAQLNVKRRRRA